MYGIEKESYIWTKSSLFYMSIIVYKIRKISVLNVLAALTRAGWVGYCKESTVYLELVYLVTALVPSDTACLASSPGRRSLTAVWISREVIVDLLL